MLSEKIRALLFYLLPHHLISGLMYRLARVRLSPVKNLAIGIYTRLIAVDMQQAMIEDKYAYASLNDFFTRALKPEARPLAPGPELLCPVDGAVSQAGTIERDRVYQAKGKDYSLQELLGDEAMASLFEDGRFATLYLSPSDYHRIHMPTGGKLKSMRYIPGRLFSVATWTVNQIPRLFARNERCICLFDTEYGAMALVLVGAINVSAIETVWHGIVKHRDVTDYHYDDSDVSLQRGDEVGRFNLGSTVIVLLQPGMQWDESITEGRSVRMGQRLAVSSGAVTQG